MKVGIVSIHSAHNYGSVLQAFALQEILKSFCNDVEIINYRPKYLENQYKMISVSIYFKYNGIVNKFLHFGWRIVMFFERYKKYKKFENFINTKYNLSQRFSKIEEIEKAKLTYDILFCGSDQIWNTDITEGFDKVFYLGFNNTACLKASYAASIGKKSIDKIYKNDYKKYLNKFNFLSLREESSLNLIKKYTDKKISICLDPTLMISDNAWYQLSLNSKLSIKKKYIFVYILEENFDMVKIVNKISSYLNLQVISISKKKRFINEQLFTSAGPEDFLYLIKNSSFVVTNSFHGTVFSLIFKKQNCIIPHKITGNRLSDLMKKVGLDARVFYKYEDFDLNEVMNPIDYNKVFKNIENEKKLSHKYIESVFASYGK